MHPIAAAVIVATLYLLVITIAVRIYGGRR
jgi:hypothetical protein